MKTLIIGQSYLLTNNIINMKVKIIAILEISDHDGYCSGEECEYTKETIEKTIIFPDELKNTDNITVDCHNWIQYLEEPTLNDGSGYCDLSAECVENNLGIHDYRYNVIAVELINE